MNKIYDLLLGIIIGILITVYLFKPTGHWFIEWEKEYDGINLYYWHHYSDFETSYMGKKILNTKETK